MAKKDHSKHHHHQQASSSLKTSKKDHSNHHHHHHQQFNNLIKVLKPKVYIIDPSSFKKLVQDLTGNIDNNNNNIDINIGTTSSNYSSSSSYSSPPSLELPKVAQLNHVEEVELPSVSIEEPTSHNSSSCNIDNYDEYYYSQLMMMNNNINNINVDHHDHEEQECFEQFCKSGLEELNDAVLGDYYVNSSSIYCDQMNYVESLLFDDQLVEEEEGPNPFYTQVQQDISIYDYDF